MAPVFGREVVERQQHIAVFLQAVAGRRILRVVFFEKVIERLVGVVFCLSLPDFMQVPLAFG